MKHASAGTLQRIEPLLAALRDLPALREPRPGVFSRSSRAFLHFHEDGADVFADVRFADDFERIRVTEPAEQSALLERIRAALPTG